MHFPFLAIPLTLLTVALYQAPVAAQAPSAAAVGKAPEVPVVMRLSKELIVGLSQKTFHRDTPIAECDSRTTKRGTAQTDGELEIEFEPSADQAVFLLKIKGTSRMQVRIERKPVVVLAGGELEFTASKRIFFDGKNYRCEATTIDGRFCPRIDGLITPPGLRGLILRAVANRLIPRELPEASENALQKGKEQIKEAFDAEVTRGIAALQKTSPLEDTIRTIFPGKPEWVYHASTTRSALFLGAGPPDGRIPVLPSHQKTQTPVELWFRRKLVDKSRAAALKAWHQANDLLERHVPDMMPRNGERGKGLEPFVVGDWFVVQVGNNLLHPEAGKGNPPKQPQP